ncbi:(5-formylfuran-3-yl)methyl phosphate synthase [Tautonia marina]|uniref:(5-formylfuran-3-yl)methyl phosphate synthase n=1 Tax=Tautonia marina TaxID=2653855 RepID=UPI001F2B9AEF|nr:(5-formylfuran-3-yl)methyl phosphate synthase [Tautonia marina]
MSRALTTGSRPGPGLLVSVRSAAEAIEAVQGGASVVDVKEPGRGPLGCAEVSVWRAVREAVSPDVPVSVALGELREWADRPVPSVGAFEGIAFRKLGLSGMVGRDWERIWNQFREAIGPGPPWIAVAYLDADRAGAPERFAIRDAAVTIPECAGILLDTWDKSRPADLASIDPHWFEPIRQSGRLIALAGGLDAVAIRRLGALRPDLFGVRGAACSGGDRGGCIERDRVRRLVEASRSSAAARRNTVS